MEGMIIYSSLWQIMMFHHCRFKIMTDIIIMIYKIRYINKGSVKNIILEICKPKHQLTSIFFATLNYGKNQCKRHGNYDYIG